MPTLPNMGLILPTPGGDSGDWDDILATVFEAIDEHDHSTGQGVKVTPAGIDIDDDLDVNAHGLIDVGRVDFTPIAALAAGANVLFVNTSDGELYWRTTGGTNVKLTNGASINTTLVGGIVGDYTAVGAEVAFDDANARFTFKDQNDDWAHVDCGDLRLHEHGTTDSNYIAIKAAGLSAPYTITLPTAAPGGDSLLQITSAGVVAFSNTLDAAVTLGSNRNITLQGTGTIKHGTRTMTVFPRAVRVSAGTVSAGDPGDATLCYNIMATGTTADFEIGPLPRAKTITAVRVYHYGPFTTSAVLTATVYRVDSSATFGSIGTANANTSPVNVSSINAGSGQSTSGFIFIVRLVSTTAEYPIQYIEVDFTET